MERYIVVFFIIAIFLTGCVQQISEQHELIKSTNSSKSLIPAMSAAIELYSSYIHHSATTYDIDEKLIKAIIQVESGYNPLLVSQSNAIGLMQLKASTAGRDVYRLKGRYGQPTHAELKNAAINIDLGTAYLFLLKKQLAEISNPETQRYALIVAYVNGMGALLRTFSSNREIAIKKMNIMTPQQFYQHIKQKHPAPQAPRYLYKVNNAYSMLH